MTDWLLGLAAVLLTLVGAGDEDPQCLRLGALDAHRVTAFAQGDAGALQEVYAFEEGVTAEQALLRQFSDRGLVLRGGGLERLECRVGEDLADRVVLQVVDRLGPTVAVDEAGRRHDLPRPAAQRRTVELVRTDAGWRIGSVS